MGGGGGGGEGIRISASGGPPALNLERRMRGNVGGCGVKVWGILPKVILKKTLGYLGQHFVRFEDRLLGN